MLTLNGLSPLVNNSGAKGNNFNSEAMNLSDAAKNLEQAERYQDSSNLDDWFKALTKAYKDLCQFVAGETRSGASKKSAQKIINSV